MSMTVVPRLKAPMPTPGAVLELFKPV
ncbi:MAG: hypothetical protein RLZZ157_1811, partial [Pseudomonadota bacterium]